MPETVDDFMARFGGSNTVDDREANAYHDRFISPRDEDRQFDAGTYHEAATQYLGKLPDDQFQQAARRAVSQTPPQERAGLLGGILGALGGALFGSLFVLFFSRYGIPAFSEAQRYSYGGDYLFPSLNAADVATVPALMFLVCLLAAFGPAVMAARKRPADSLRYV